jgi:hypothetical protein
MRTPHVCTETTTHGRIVSSNPQALGASTSSRRIRREENHFFFAVGTNYHLCAWNHHGSKMFTPYPFSRIGSGVLFCGSGEISVLGAAENMGASPRGARPCSRTKHKAERFPQTPAQVLDLMRINLFYSLTRGSSFHSVKWPSAKTSQSFRLSFALFGFFMVNPLFKSAFRNRLCVHAALDYRPLSKVIGFEILLFNSVLSLVAVCKDSSVLVIDYRRLSRIIGFEISFSLNRAKPFSSPPRPEHYP